MGKRGPHPTPTALLKLRGSRWANENKNEPQPELGVPASPGFTSKDERQVWEQMTEQLNAIGVLSKIDGNVLERYCRMLVRWRRAEQFIEKNGESYSLLDENGEVRCWMQYPEVSISHRLSAALGKIEVEFGMTPSSRSRIKVEKPAAASTVAKRNRA